MSGDDLRGRRVLIVGGSSGVGLAVAGRAVAAGAEVTLAARQLERLEAARRSLAGAVEICQMDAAADASVASGFARLAPLDHVVSSIPSFAPTGPLPDLDLEAAGRAVDAKLFGNARVARAAMTALREDGSLTLVAAISSRLGHSGASLLGATNAAVESLGRSLAAEMAPRRVNVVSPGVLDTDYWSRLPDDQRRRMLEEAAAALPLKRVGTADDVAVLVVALMVSRFVTGAVVDVDGGAQLG